METKLPTRTLIVDDNDESARTMGWMMEMLGHEIVLAHDGRTALQVAAEKAFDLVLLDIGLPDMSGYELLAEMKKLPGTQPVFVAQSGWDRQPEKEKPGAAFDHHLVKPVDLEKLKSIAAKISAASGLRA